MMMNRLRKIRGYSRFNVKKVVILLAVISVLLLTIEHYVIEQFIMTSNSMIPTLLVDDIFFVNKFKYGLHLPFMTKRFIKFQDPKRGEVVVFVYPKDNKKDIIKRVVGVAGDYIEFKDRTLFINGQAVEKTKNGTYNFNSAQSGSKEVGDLFIENLDNHKYFVLYSNHSESKTKFDYLPIKVPEGFIFVMGDNRDNSLDSRSWGLVPLDNLKGEALFILFPIDKFFKVVR